MKTRMHMGWVAIEKLMMLFIALTTRIQGESRKYIVNVMKYESFLLPEVITFIVLALSPNLYIFTLQRFTCIKFLLYFPLTTFTALVLWHFPFSAILKTLKGKFSGKSSKFSMNMKYRKIQLNIDEEFSKFPRN